MLPPENAIHLLVPNESNERVLYAGRMTKPGDELIVEFDREIAPPVGTEVNIFFDLGGKFMQQGATIVAVSAAAPIEAEASEEESKQEPPATEFVAVQVVTIRRSGQAVSAESRGSFRVSVLGLESFARLEGERRCQIVDVSPEGLAVMCSRPHRLGSLLNIIFESGEGEQNGRVRVQTVRELPNGKFRCGLLVPSVEKKMRSALQRMTSWAQRLQLQRVRKSA